MLSSTARERPGATAQVRGSAMSGRYDRMCPFVRQGRQCSQHYHYLLWCAAKERNDAPTQLLTSSSAMVLMTFRPDTIQKLDCPFLHPATDAETADMARRHRDVRESGAGLRGMKAAAVRSATERRAALIEGIVDYLLVAADTAAATAASAAASAASASASAGAAVTVDGAVIGAALQRDTSTAACADGIVGRLHATLAPECQAQWRSCELTFSSVEFCSCFVAAVAVLYSPAFGRRVRSLYLADNAITSDGIDNLLRAMKSCPLPAPQLPPPSQQPPQPQPAPQSLASQLVLLDIAGNGVDSLRFLFELKALCPRLLALTVARNPITRRDDYVELVRRNVPQVVVLDGANIRRPPLAMPFPSLASIGAADANAASATGATAEDAAMQRAARIFIAAYLRAWEVFAPEFFKDDATIRDKVMHPAIHGSLCMQPGTSLGLPSDVTTEDEFAARLAAPVARGGRVGAATVAAAQALVAQRAAARLGVASAATGAPLATATGRREREGDDADAQVAVDDAPRTDAPATATATATAPLPRFVTKLDAKLLRALPVACGRSNRSIAEGRVSVERIARGRLEVTELLASTLYPEGLAVSHHARGCIVSVTPICIPSLAAVPPPAPANAKKSKKQPPQPPQPLFRPDAAAEQPPMFLITVHGVVTWRSPSLTGQDALTVAADQTFTVVATEREAYFAAREDEAAAALERALSGAIADEDDGGSGSGPSTFVDMERVELIRWLNGFRICNHAVMLRSVNASGEGADGGSAGDATAALARKPSAGAHHSFAAASATGAAHGASSFAHARFLFDPLRSARVERLAHIYGARPSDVARVLERSRSDLECEETLARTLSAAAGNIAPE